MAMTMTLLPHVEEEREGVMSLTHTIEVGVEEVVAVAHLVECPCLHPPAFRHGGGGGRGGGGHGGEARAVPAAARAALAPPAGRRRHPTLLLPAPHRRELRRPPPLRTAATCQWYL